MVQKLKTTRELIKGEAEIYTHVPGTDTWTGMKRVLVDGDYVETEFSARSFTELLEVMTTANS